MIVPTNRLLFWFAAIALPFSALGALYAEAMVLSIALIAAMLVVAVVDAALALGSLDSVSLQLPPLLRFSKERDGLIEVTVKNPSRQARRLRIGLPLPPEIASTQDDVMVTLPAEAEQSRLDWACRPLSRGNFHLRRGYLESPSRLGFWNVRRTVPVQCELRVYPNLLTERKDLAALFLRRGALGVHAQRQIGKGRDFEKLRDYVPGDSFDEIHWKATARRGHPITKEFQIEKTQEVYVLIDSSRLSARASGGDSILERFITAGLLLGVAAERQGDRFGLISFSDRVERFVPAKSGKRHFGVCRDALYTVKERLVSPDFYELCTFVQLRLRRRALLLVLTELDDPVLAESFERSIHLISRQHLVLVSALKPSGLAPLFQGAPVSSESDVYSSLASHMRWQKLQEVSKRLRHCGVQFSLLEPENMALQLAAQYQSVKQRQLL